MLSGGYFFEDEIEPPFDLIDALRPAEDCPITPPNVKNEL
jgi:hypothetical protein